MPVVAIEMVLVEADQQRPAAIPGPRHDIGGLDNDPPENSVGIVLVKKLRLYRHCLVQYIRTILRED